jgi:integrase
MYSQFEEVIKRIRTELCLTPRATEESTQFVADLVAGPLLDIIKIAYELFADMAEVRHGTRGIALAVDGIGDLIRACCIAFDIELDAEIQLFDSLVSFKSHLRKLPSHINDFSTTPRKKDNVIIYFLVHTRNGLIRQTESTDGANRWRDVCLVGFLGTRMGLNSSVATQNHTQGNGGSPKYGSVDHQAKDSARAVEIFIKHVALSKINPRTPHIVASSLIEHTISKIAKEAEGLRREYTVERYVRWTCVLLNRSLLNRQRRVGTIDQQELPPGETELIEIAKDPAPEAFVPVSDQESCAIEVGAVIDDPSWLATKGVEIEEGASPYEFTPLPTPSDILSLRAGLRERSYLFRPLGWTPVWQSNVLTQETLGTILAYLINNTPIERMEAIQLGVLCFIVVQIHFGFSGDRLAEAKLGHSSCGGSSKELSRLAYNKEHGTFQIYPEGHDGDAVFANAGIHTNAPYLSGAESLKLIAPQLIKWLLNRFLSLTERANDRLFAFFTNDGLSVVLDPVTINQRLKPLKEILSQKVDVNRIGRSAVLHLATYGKVEQHRTLDELIIAFVSGFIPRHLAAQAHYVNLSIRRIQIDYSHAVQSTFERLCEVSRGQSETLGFEGLSRLKQFCPPYPVTGGSSMHTVEERYGSPFVPQTEDVRAYLGILRKSLEASPDRYLRFNQLTAYVALALMFVSGMRPIEVALLTDDRIWLLQDGSEGLICAKSKPNREYDEWRAVVIPSPFGSLFKTYRLEAARMLELMYEEGLQVGSVQQDFNGSFFFFIVGQRRKVVRLTTQTLRSLLREGPGGELKMGSFLWRLNSPRHLYGTTALQMGFPRRIIDELMGHQTRGREMLGRYSLSFLTELKHAAQRISETIAEQLNISPLITL